MVASLIKSPRRRNSRIILMAGLHAADEYVGFLSYMAIANSGC
jgi:hypothetical protein